MLICVIYSINQAKYRNEVIESVINVLIIFFYIFSFLRVCNYYVIIILMLFILRKFTNLNNLRSLNYDLYLKIRKFRVNSINIVINQC